MRIIAVCKAIYNTGPPLYIRAFRRLAIWATSGGSSFSHTRPGESPRTHGRECHCMIATVDLNVSDHSWDVPRNRAWSFQVRFVSAIGMQVRIYWRINRTGLILGMLIFVREEKVKVLPHYFVSEFSWYYQFHARLLPTMKEWVLILNTCEDCHLVDAQFCSPQARNIKLRQMDLEL